MKMQNLARTTLAALALSVAAFLLAPARQAAGFTKLGGALSAESQRDFRVFNNFSDPESNDNTTPYAQFPGYDGAEMAFWKAGVEWGSGPHGDGSGDPTQPNLGDGGANFDYIWAGNADGIGTTDNNIISALSSCGGGGTLAFTETPISNGWRTRFCDEWTWFDGPDAPPSGATSFDLQGIGCHELGHALGLGHSLVSSATMSALGSGGKSELRSIESDDMAGLQCIYNVKAPTKPVITGFTVNGTTLRIEGVNFAPVFGEVWFTSAATTATGADPLVKVTGVNSGSGGTVISVTIPAAAGLGDIAVKQALAGHDTLSNAFPFDGVGSGTGPALTLTSVTPSTFDNLIPGIAETITITGTGFTPATTIEVDGAPIAGRFTPVSSTSMTFEWEPSTLGLHSISVVEGGLSDSFTVFVRPNTLPTIQVAAGDGHLVLVGGDAPVILAGLPGEMQYLLVSDSNIPSEVPGKINLAMGNVFTQIGEAGLFVIGGTGTTTVNVPLGTFMFTNLYWQSLEIFQPINYPLQESNLESTITP